jgi:hypothetical protein
MRFYMGREQRTSISSKREVFRGEGKIQGIDPPSQQKTYTT